MVIRRPTRGGAAPWIPGIRGRQGIVVAGGEIHAKAVERPVWLRTARELTEQRTRRLDVGRPRRGRPCILRGMQDQVRVRPRYGAGQRRRIIGRCRYLMSIIQCGRRVTRKSAPSARAVQAPQASPQHEKGKKRKLRVELSGQALLVPEPC